MDLACNAGVTGRGRPRVARRRIDLASCAIALKSVHSLRGTHFKVRAAALPGDDGFQFRFT